MQINLIPQRNDASLTLEKQGETLLVNGIAHDFSALTDTATWKAESDHNENQAHAYGNPLLQQVRRDDGEIRVWLVFPYAANQHPGWDETTIQVDVDGPIELPA